MLPPESASPEVVSREIGVGVSTLEKWRSQALGKPAQDKVWTAAARLQAVIATAAMDEASRNAWCRENGLYVHQLQQWKDSATQSLAAPEETRRASPSQTKADRRRIKELERELRRKESALAEAAALLVLSKKTAAIFQRNMQGEDE